MADSLREHYKKAADRRVIMAITGSPVQPTLDPPPLPPAREAGPMVVVDADSMASSPGMMLESLDSLDWKTVQRYFPAGNAIEPALRAILQKAMTSETPEEMIALMDCATRSLKELTKGITVTMSKREEKPMQINTQFNLNRKLPALPVARKGFLKTSSKGPAKNGTLDVPGETVSTSRPDSAPERPREESGQ